MSTATRLNVTVRWPGKSPVSRKVTPEKAAWLVKHGAEVKGDQPNQVLIPLGAPMSVGRIDGLPKRPGTNTKG